MLTYTVQVDFTDRSRNADRTFVTSTRTVTVLADNDTEATLVATQLVTALRADLDGMPVASRILDCLA